MKKTTGNQGVMEAIRLAGGLNKLAALIEVAPNTITYARDRGCPPSTALKLHRKLGIPLAQLGIEL